MMQEYTVNDCFYQIRNGANIKQGDADGGYPITRIETTANDTFNRDRMGYAGISDLSQYESYVLEDGDLLMSHINSVQYLGRTVLYKKQGDEVIIHGMNLLSLKANRNIILPEYARYLFYSAPFKKQLGRITKKSVNQASFTVSDLKKIPLSLHPIDEQASIVSILDKSHTLIEKRQNELSILDDLIKARFIEMFGGSDYSKATIADLIAGKVPSIKKDFKRDDTIKYIDISSIDNQRNVITGYTEYILCNAPSRAQQHILQGDILVSTVRPNLRNVAMTTYSDDNLVASSGFCVLRASKCLPSYLKAIVCSDDFTESMSHVVTGANYPAIKDSDVLSYKVSVPPMDKQHEFEKITFQIEKTKAAVQKALDEAQLLFDSLMQQYFG